MLLVSCASAARHQMQVSKRAYQDCLRAHPGDAGACEEERLIFDADLQAAGMYRRNANMGMLLVR